MAQIVVTGGGGFIGSHLVDALLAKGDRVIAIDVDERIPKRLSHLTEGKNFHYIAIDVRDKQKLAAAIPSNCRMIYHLAAMVGVKNYCDDPLKTIDVNFGGLRNIIDIALANKAKIIFASTSEIYGKNPDIPWHEDADRVLGSTSIDRWSYSSSKGICEHILFGVYRKYHLPVVIIRFFNVYGPRQNPIFVVPAMIVKALKDENPQIFDTGEQTRCFTFITDAIEGVLKASENPSAEGEAFNIGSTHEITMAEVSAMIIEIMGKSSELQPEYIDAKELYGSYEDIMRRIPDVSKARSVLNWEAKTSLEIGLKRTIEYFKKQ